MAKTKVQKKEIVDTLVDEFAQSKLIVLSEIKGLTTVDMDKLRASMRKENVKHKVVKISLLKLALNKAGIPARDVKTATQVAISFSPDETASARLLKNFAKTNDKLKMIGGFLEKRYIDQAQVTQLASVPSRLELLGQLVGVLAGPARGLVTVLSGSHRGLVQVLSQVKKSE